MRSDEAHLPLLVHGYGARVFIDAPPLVDLAAALNEVLPPQVTVEPADATAAADVRFAVVEARRGWFRISRDGVRVGRARRRVRAVRALRARIELGLARHARIGTFVHAGVVEWRGVAILLPGSSHAGKSTLVAELVRLGATYYSDEYAVVDADGLVHPYARPIARRDGSAPLRPDGGSAALPVGLIVATTYQPGAAWAPLLLSGARALLPILDNVVIVRARPARGLRLVARLPRDVLTLQGPRPDAAEVAPAILATLDRLLDGERAQLTAVRRAAIPRLAAAPPTSAGDAASGGLRAAPYLRIDGLLQPDEHRRLLDYALAHEADFGDSSVYNADQTSTEDSGHRRSRSFFDLDAVWDLFEPRLTHLLPYVRQELGVPWFRLEKIERQLHVHGDGDFFAKHTDNAYGDVVWRRLSAVYYFFETPKRFAGGELCLYDVLDVDGRSDAAPSCTVLDPVDNSLVFFASDVVHEVRPVQRAASEFAARRFTITFWFRAAEVPGEGPGLGGTQAGSE
jgi:Rps23 Pro-64 3,4-dihydroxylase Tpa1-like proline 4-hydroxylase